MALVSLSILFHLMKNVLGNSKLTPIWFLAWKLVCFTKADITVAFMEHDDLTGTDFQTTVPIIVVIGEKFLPKVTREVDGIDGG